VEPEIMKMDNAESMNVLFKRKIVKKGLANGI
jgi:hypothetical protein